MNLSTISNNKAFKNKNIILTESEIKYFKDILNILSIFVYAITKLQADKYPTIYYLMPIIYSIYNKLSNIKIIYQVLSILKILYKFISSITNL
jgi:hypothetical protein